MKIKQGQEYKRRDGAKMTQNLSKDGGLWFGSDGVWREDDGGTALHNDIRLSIIAEWPSEPEGDKIQGVEFSHVWYGEECTSDKDTAEDKPNWGAWVLRDPDIFWDAYPVDGPVKVVEDEDGNVVAYCVPMPPVRGEKDAADDKPKTWRDLTDEAKGALLLAAHEDKTCEMCDPDDPDAGWHEAHNCFVGDLGAMAYRIRKEPVREAVAVGVHKHDREWWGCGPRATKPPFTLHIPTIDTKPIPGTYTNEAGDVVTIEELA